MPELDQDLSIKERVSTLLNVVEEGQRALICTHDNPDPDSIASAFALGRLLQRKKNIEFTLTYGGVLGRAENREMVRLLKIPLVPIHRIDMDEFDVVGLVDTQPEVGNHQLTEERSAGKTMICVDHHPARQHSKDAAYADVGGDFGATSTLLTHYLHVAGVEPDRTLATALFYGIKSDTRDLGREVSGDDVWAYTHLVSMTDMPLVSAIEHPRLPRAYFSVLVRAIQKAEMLGDVVICDLGDVYVPDLVPETADRLATAEGVRWSIVVGEYESQIYTSLRVNDRRFSAGKLVREVMARYPNGSAGGHGSMAGARLPHAQRCRSAAARTRARRGFLKALALATGIDPLGKPERFAPDERTLANSPPPKSAPKPPPAPKVAKTPSSKSPSTKSPATKSPATKSPATKSPSTKGPAGKSAPKKGSANNPASKTSGIKAASKNAVSKNAASKNAVSKNAASKNAASKKAASKNAASKNAATKNAATKNAATKNAATKNAATKNAATKNAASKNAATKNAASKSAASKNAATKNAASKNAATKNAASKNAATKNAVQKASSKPAPRRAGMKADVQARPRVGRFASTPSRQAKGKA